MRFKSSSLPLHHEHHHSRRVGFEEKPQNEESLGSRIRHRIRRLAYIAIHASTGSPSDGIGGDGTESTTSTPGFIASQKQIAAEMDGDDWKVDEVVVAGGDADHWKRVESERDTTTGGSPGQSDADSVHHERMQPWTDSPSSTGLNRHYTPSLLTRVRSAWDVVKYFFDPRFEDDAAEMEFRKLNWYSSKAFAFYASLFLVLNWALYLALNQDSTKTMDYAQGFYYGGLTALTLPLPFLIASDAPLRHSIPFQIWFNLAVWWCGLTEIIQMRKCGFFKSGGRLNCAGKDFLAMMYYITAIPALMMFVVAHRLYSAIMMVVATVLIAALIMTAPGQGIFARNLVSFIIFSVFLQALHYNKEVTERRLYLLNTQLKVAYRAQQKAQIAQSRASQAKRRFASYIFHEVRVPLNNAAIAFNNLMISNILFDRVSKPHVEDVKALEVSLETVQQVLNDALDLEKMDAGRFEIKPRNFPLHTVIRSTLAPLVITAAAKKLELKINLDPRIDALAHRMVVPQIEIAGGKPASKEGNEKERDDVPPRSPHPLYSPTLGPPSPRPKVFEAADYISGGPTKVERTSSGSSLNSPKRRRSFKYSQQQPQTPVLPPSPMESSVKGDEGELWVVGDEVRLRQVLTNLVSNAIKFTPAGTTEGITFSTSLVTFIEGANNGEGPASRRQSRDGRHSHDGEKDVQGASQDVLVIRMEIVDNGPGIKPSDLVDGQLFQPFGQTRVGRLSRNSTGLGLAIVRQIVLNSAGRLGVQSQKGRGATFWVELSYPVAKMRVNPAEAMKSYFTATGSIPPSTIISSAPDFTSSVPNQPPPPGLPLTPLTELSESTIAPPASFDESPKISDVNDPNPLDRLSPNPPPETQSSISEVARTVENTSPPFSLPTSPEGEEKLLVLVVDDDSLTRKMLSRSLGFRNCVVHTAQDGKECVDILLSPDAPHYDLVTLDNYMPVMTGEEAVKEIRRAGNDVFVVGCTGNALTDDQNSYLEAGADRVLPKPINYKSGQLEEILQIARQRRMERQRTLES